MKSETEEHFLTLTLPIELTNGRNTSRMIFEQHSCHIILPVEPSNNLLEKHEHGKKRKSVEKSAIVVENKLQRKVFLYRHFLQSQKELH